MIDVIPLADRVLIKPDTPASVSEGGIHLVEDWPDEVSGTVAACGRARHPRKDEAFEMARIMDDWADTGAFGRIKVFDDAAQLLRELTGREPAVAVGDRVLFARSSGQELHINDVRYFVMREADLLAILDGTE